MQEQTPNEVLIALEAMIQNGALDREKLTELGLLSEAQLKRLDSIIDNAEQNNELMNIVIQIMDKMSKKEEPEVKKVQILGAEIITIKGEKGDSPTKEELEEIIKPLIPEVKDGETPTDDELIKLITPLIPEPVKGDPGDDYVITDSDKKEIASMIEVPIVEKVIEKTEVIKEVTKEVPNEITGEELVGKLKSIPRGKRLDYEDLDNTPDIPSLFSRIRAEVKTWGNGFLRELSDVEIGNTDPQDGYVLKWSSALKKWITGPGGSGGTVTPTNGLQTIGSDIGLGGSLTQNTTIVGGLFSWLLSALDVTLLGSNSAEIAAPTTSVSATSVLRVRTPDVNDASATAGHFLKLIDASTGESEFSVVPISGVNGLQAALDAKANDSDVVHKTGNETISGEKTFTGKVITDTNQAETSAGGSLKAANGTTVATYGQGNSSNFTAEGAVKLNAHTASRILTTDANKNIETVNTKTTDGTLVGNSDTNIPTEKAVKTYVDNEVKEGNPATKLFNNYNFI